jgi:hypothetical protein
VNFWYLSTLLVDESSPLAQVVRAAICGGATGGNHMPATRKKTASHDFTEFNAMIEPRPLPPHFGEIDVTAPFDPHRYFTMLRSAGVHIYLWRHFFNDESYPDDNRVVCCWNSNRVGFVHGPSELHKRRFHEAMAWKNAQDKDDNKTNLFFLEIVKSKPAGNFIHYLGC